MPKDGKGHWMPTTHKAATYTQKEATAADRLLDRFGLAAKGQTVPVQKAMQRPALQTVQRVLTPMGETQFAATLKGRRRMQAAIQMAERMRDKSRSNAANAWIKGMISKSFGKAKTRDNIKGWELE